MLLEMLAAPASANVKFREHSADFIEHSVDCREHSVDFREHSVDFREHSVDFKNKTMRLHTHTFICKLRCSVGGNTVLYNKMDVAPACFDYQGWFAV